MAALERADVRCAACGRAAAEYKAAAHQLPPETVLEGRYLLGCVLGEGGFGMTYIGRDMKLEMKVAVKEYFPAEYASRRADVSPEVSCPAGALAQSYAEGREKFLREARAMARVSGRPEIVGVRDCFEANNTAYIVMEYVDGVTLKALVERRGGRLPSGEALRLAEPLFRALDAMHAEGLIHRDVSPENIMIDGGGMARLLDFGCAREAAAGSRTVTVSLKYGYAPIEQYQSKGQGPWTDVYALAATLYFCVTGTPPPRAADRAVEDRLTPPRELGAQLTQKQERALLRALEVKPGRRFRSMMEFHAALYEDAAAPPEKTAKPSRRRWLAPLAVVLAAAALALALVPRLAAKKAPAQSAVQVGEQEDMFAEAVIFDGGEENGEERLRELMLDESVKAVVIPNGTNLSVLGRLDITKPVLVDEGVFLNTWSVLTVDGENACLEVRGALCPTGLVRTRNGGRIIAERASKLDALWTGMLWLESADDLTLMDGSEYLLGDGQVLVCGLDDIFAAALDVSNIDELGRAMNDESVSAVNVVGNITHTGSLRISKPLSVSEGASLAVSDGMYCDLTAVVENRGRIDAAVNMDSALLYNTGVFSGGITANTAAVINHGYMSLTAASRVNGSAHACFYNDVDASLQIAGDGESVFAFGGGRFLNGGAISASNARVELGADLAVCNIGSISVNGGARLANSAIMQNYAGITVNGGAFSNDGVIIMREAASALRQQSGEVTNTGIIFAEDYHVQLEDDVGGIVRLPCESDTDCAFVQSSEELCAAMDDPSVNSVWLKGWVDLDGDLTVTKPFVVEDELNIRGNITVADGYIYQDMFGWLLRADELTLKSRTFFVQQSRFSAQTVTTEDGTRVYSKE